MHAEQTVRRDQRAAQRLGARPARGQIRDRVLDHHPQAVEPERRLDPGRGQVHGGRRRPPAAHHPRRARPRTQRFGVGAAQDEHRYRQRSVFHVDQVGQRHGEVNLAGPPLVEAQLAGAIHVKLVDRHETPPGITLLDAAPDHLQEPQPHKDRRRPGRLQQAVGLLERPAGRARDARRPRRGLLRGPPRRGQHPELPAHPVLARGPAVGVKQVALIEHRVGDRTRRVEPGGYSVRHARRCHRDRCPQQACSRLPTTASLPAGPRRDRAAHPHHK